MLKPRVLHIQIMTILFLCACDPSIDFSSLSPLNATTEEERNQTEPSELNPNEPGNTEDALAPVQASTSPPLQVTVTVRNNSEDTRVAEYVTTGVPIPQSWSVSDPGALMLRNGAGEPVPVQITPTARWGSAPDDTSRSLQWVLLTFEASLPPHSREDFVLELSPAQAMPAALSIARNDDAHLVIETGAASFTLSKANGAWLERAEVSGVVLTHSADNALVMVGEDGKVFSSVGVTPERLVIEEQGPLKLVVRADGTLRDAQGNPGLDFSSWMTFYANKSYVKVLCTIGNHSKAALGGSSYDVFRYFGQNSRSFLELSAQLSLSAGGEANHLLVPSEAGLAAREASHLWVYQDSSGTDYWDRYAGAGQAPRLGSYVQRRGYEVKSSSGSLEQGDHFPGWIDISSAEGGVTVGMRHFWQSYPKGLAAQDGQVKLGLFPAEHSSTYNFRVGEEKTTELFLYFHAGDGVTSGAESTAQSLLHPMRALAAARWYIETGAIQPFVESPDSPESRFGGQHRSEDRFRYEYYLDRALLADPQYADASYYYPFHSLWLSTPGHPSSTDYFDLYGWSWYGNQPLEQESTNDGQSGPFDDKYDLDFGVWLQYLRSGDERWAEMGEAYSRHTEALMLHDVITETGWDIARWKNAIFGHSQHNESGNTNSVRNMLGPVGDTAYGARGASLHYYLTGYPVSRRFVLKAADYGYDFYQKTMDADPGFAPSREAANLLSLLNEGFRLTGDLKYQRRIQSLIESYAAEKQEFIYGPVPGSSRTLPTWIFGHYYNGIARYAELAEAYGLFQEAAFARAQVVTFVDWHMRYATKEAHGWLASYYSYRLDGNNDASSPDMINNWTLLLADSCAYAYAFSGDPRFLHWAESLFRTGTQNPFYEGSPLIFSASKEAVNHLVFGHVYLYQAQLEASTNDREAPRVALIAPKDGETLSGRFSLQAEATDDIAVLEVRFYLDGQLLGLDISAPYSLELDTRQYEDGDYRLEAEAVDGSGKKGLSDPITVSFSGGAPPSTPTPPLASPTPGVPDAGEPEEGTPSASVTPPPSESPTPTESVSPTPPPLQEPTLSPVPDSEPGSTPTSATPSPVPTAKVLRSVLLTEDTGARDTLIRRTYEGNYGQSDFMYVYNGYFPDYRALIWFDLSPAGISAGVEVLSARLLLHCLSASDVPSDLHRITRDWQEGRGTYGNTHDGATWTTWEGSSPWEMLGGDIDVSSDYGFGPTGIVDSVEAREGNMAFDVTALAQAWLSEAVPNHGMLLTLPGWVYYSTVKFSSLESERADWRPMLEIEYLE